MTIVQSPKEAEQAIRRSIKLYNNEKNSRILTAGYNRFGLLLSLRSEYDFVITVYRESLVASYKIAFKTGISNALYGFGYCYRRKGNALKAHEFQKRHMKLANEIGDSSMLADSEKLLASIYTETGEYALAMKSYIAAAEGYQKIGNLKNWASTLSNIGLVQLRLENYESAKAYLFRSDSIYMEINNIPGRAHVQYNLAVILKNSGKLDSAKCKLNKRICGPGIECAI